MRIVGIIPSRYGSSRFQGKPLAEILGKSLIRHVYERASASGALDELLIATDDPRIAREAEAFGAACYMTSEEHGCGTDRVAEVASQIQADVVVNIQGDEIISDGSMIDECVLPLSEDGSLDVSTLAAEITHRHEVDDPNVVKVVRDQSGHALFFSRSPIPNTSRASLPAGAGASFLRHIGIYAYRRSFLLELVKLGQTPLELAESLEQLRILEYGRKMAVVVTRFSSLGVDVPSDLKKAEAFLASTGRAGSERPAGR